MAISFASDVPVMILKFDLFYRFIATQHLFSGIGLDYFITINDGEGDGPPGQLLSPSLSFAYKSTRYELDQIASPYAFDPIFDGGRDLLGIKGRTDLAYFFSLKAGLRLSADYAILQNLKNPNDTVRFLLANVGIAIRL